MRKSIIPIRAVLAAAAALAAPAGAGAAPFAVENAYNLTGGETLLSASGPASVIVSGTAFGVGYSIARTGRFSGATSWDYGGTLGTTVQPDGAFQSFHAMSEFRRAGAILADFPVVALPGDAPSLNVDVAMLSNDSSLDVFSADGGLGDNVLDGVLDRDGEGAGTIGAAGGVALVDYDAPTGLRVGFRNLGVATRTAMSARLTLANDDDGGSRASLEMLSADFATSFEVAQGCLLRGGLRDRCLVDATLTYDFSGMQGVVTSKPATGASQTPLPEADEAMAPVPLPATAWMTVAGAAALGAAALCRRYSRPIP